MHKFGTVSNLQRKKIKLGYYILRKCDVKKLITSKSFIAPFPVLNPARALNTHCNLLCNGWMLKNG